MPDGTNDPEHPRLTPPSGGSTLDRIAQSLRRRFPEASRRIDQAVALLGLTRPHLAGLAVAFAVAIAAGIAFTLARLPLPWMLGPLTIALILAVLGRPLAQPHVLVQPIRALLGVAVGASFTPELVDKAGGTLLSLTLMVPYMAVVTAAGMAFLVRFARFDRPTAFFASAPGGLADMILMARDTDADLRRVTLVQAARLLAIVFLIPFWLQFIGGEPLGGAMPKTGYLGELLLVDAIVICLLAWVGTRIANMLGLLGGSIVGPMVLSALAHGLGLTTAKVPVEVLVLAQIAIGLVIGANFKGISLREFVTVLSWGFSFAILLVVSAAMMAVVTARITGLDGTSLFLSYAPGGQNEMAIVALVLGLDAAIIALHHLLRVFMVVICAQVVFSRTTSWRRDRVDKDGGKP